MKSPFTLLLLLAFSPIFLLAQTYQLTVQNGHGSTSAAAGDTLHIWAEAFSFNRTFSHWSGDTSFLERPNEWHTRVIMPAHAVTVMSNTKLLPTGNTNPLKLENIMGRDTLKRVFSYFPENSLPKGVCWLWHGTGGSASSWAGGEFEQFQFVKYLIANGWAVIVTESEESTKNQDLNGDGNLRYDFSPDTLVNIDFQNIRAIRDTFMHRGKMNWSTPQASVGFSAGGAFSTMLSAVFNWNAAITHCAPGIGPVIEVAPTPFLFSMNLLDNHPDVGAAGNVEAFQNYQMLVDKDQCTQFYMLRPQPLHPERFQRFPGISLALSNAIYNELKANNCLNAKDFLQKNPVEIELLVFANPSNWPVILGLTSLQRQFVSDQVQVLWTDHHFHSDFMAADFKFIETACGLSVSTQTPPPAQLLQLFPNPSSGWLSLPAYSGALQVFDLDGKMVLKRPASEQLELDVSALSPGLYFMEIEVLGQRKLAKFIKF